MSKIEILQTDSLIPRVRDELSAVFRVHRLWEADDQATWMNVISADIKAIACGPDMAIDARFMDRIPMLEIIANFGVGYDNIDAGEAAKRNILVTNTPDVLTEEVADTAIGLMIMTARELPAAERWLRAGKWKSGYPLSRGTLRNKTLGIFGLGRIGKAIARRAEAMGIKIIYHNRTRQPDVSYAYCATLKNLAEQCDILLSVAPGGPATDGIINSEIFQALGRNGIFVNIGRGSVVDEPALIDALQNKTILSAGLDVFKSEPHVPEALIAMDHVVLLPHLGSASVDTRNAMGQLQVDNLVHWFEKNAPLTPVAETPWPKD
jgi:lactate dehydrogenase-like 2-hydroxyacid dehydrogenase